MSGIPDSRYDLWRARSCDLAGLVGPVAALAGCALVYAGRIGPAFWVAVAFGLGGNALYLANLLARRVMGASRLSWRELILAGIVPAAALAVTAAIGGECAGWFAIPGLGTAAKPTRVITISPSGDGGAPHVTHAQ